jgi:hypothetical protein
MGARLSEREMFIYFVNRQRSAFWAVPMTNLGSEEEQAAKVKPLFARTQPFA